MKKLTVLFASLALCATALVSTASAIEVSGDAYVGVADKYLWRGIDLSDSQPVMQGGVDLSAGGFTLSYWTNTQLSGGDEDFLKAGDVTETDIVLDYSFDVSELLSVSVGDIYYSFNVPGSTHELYLGASLNTILAPSLTVYYDWDAANDANLNGLFYSASIGHDLSLSEALSLSLGAAATYNDESPFVGAFSDWHNYELSVGADYALTEQIVVSAAVLYSDALSDDAELVIEDDAVASVSVALNF